MKQEMTIKLRAMIHDAGTFAEKIDLLQAVGLSKARAIWFAHKNSPEGFNAWARRRQNRSGGVVMQTL